VLFQPCSSAEFKFMVVILTTALRLMAMTYACLQILKFSWFTLWLLIYAKVAFSRSAVGGTLRLLSMPVESSSKTYSERSCIFVFQKYFIKIGEARISYLCFAILRQFACKHCHSQSNRSWRWIYACVYWPCKKQPQKIQRRQLVDDKRR